MDFTFLVIANQPPGKIAPLGQICAVQRDAGTWGRKEGPPRFARIAYTGTVQEARYIYSDCRYDFTADAFVNLDTGEPFDASVDIVEHTSDFSDGEARDAALVQQIIPSPSGDDCNDLRPDFLGDTPMREYWVRRWWPYRRFAFIRRLIETALYGTYSDTRRVLRSLTAEQRQATAERLTVREVRYLKAICLSDSKQDYLDYLAGVK